MAASTTLETRGLLTAGRYRLLRELGSRVLSTYAALHEQDGGNHLFVIERLARGGRVGDEDAADYIRDARRIAELEHPNIVRVREVGIRPDEVIVASDYIEGETLESMLGFAGLGGVGKAPLDVVLRALVDVLTGLGALHNLRDVKRQPLKLVHGELTPANVVVGLDGTARVIQVCRVQALATRPGRTGSGYLAPEVLLADGSADPRSDVYSVGVLLWEALSGRRMLSEAAPHAIVAHILSGRVARAVAPADAPWANDLVAVAHRALSADPTARFANSAAMAAELRRVAGAKLATTGRVAAFVKQAYGAKIAARREALVTHDGSVVTTSPVAAPIVPAPEPDLDEATQSRMTTSPPPPADEGFDIPIEADSLDPEPERQTSPAPEPSPRVVVASPSFEPTPIAPAFAAPIASPVTLPLAMPLPVPIAPPIAPAVMAIEEMPPLPVASPLFDDEPAFEPMSARRKWLVLAALFLPLVVLTTWGSCRALAPRTTQKDVAGVRTAPSATATTTTAVASTTATPTAIPTAVASVTPPAIDPASATAPPPPVPPATDTATARPPAFVPGYVPPKPPARPQPTYDPQGI